MTIPSRFGAGLFGAFFAAVQLFAQGPDSTQIVEQASPSVALVLTGRAPADAGSGLGTAVVVGQNGVLLTAYHLLKDAYSVQIRLKNGEIFDQVRLLGVDTRRDVAAIRITAAALSPLAMVKASDAKSGDSVVVISHAAGLPWSASTGVISAYRPADEVPGAGSGYRLLQFTAPVSPGSSGGVVLDSQGKGLALVVSSLRSAQNLNFAVPFENVLGLAEAPATKTFASGAALKGPSTAASLISSSVPSPVEHSQPASRVTPDAPEKSDILSASKDKDFILRNFKTMYIDAKKASYFDSAELKGAFGNNDDFGKLGISIVDDPSVADTILTVSYVFAWDYPFQLKHQNSSIVLLSGKGYGPFSGPLGAVSVAAEFVKAAKKYRAAKPQPKK